MTTRWPRSAQAERPMPPVVEIEAWIARHHAVLLQGDLAAVRLWREEFTAWCHERGVDPVEAVRAAALAKMEG